VIDVGTTPALRAIRLRWASPDAPLLTGGGRTGGESIMGGRERIGHRNFRLGCWAL